MQYCKHLSSCLDVQLARETSPTDLYALSADNALSGTLALWHRITVGLYIRGGECQSGRQLALTDAYDIRYIYFGSSNIRTSKTWQLCVHNYFSKERYVQRVGEIAK